MMLAEDNEIVREEKIIANIMNDYLTNITTHPPKTQTHQNLSQRESKRYNRYLPKS